MLRTYRRFHALDAADRSLVLEAAALVFVVWAGLRVVSYETLRRRLGRWSGAYLRRRGASGRVGWAIAAVCRRLPWPPSCLVEALAAEALLRRHGLVPELRFGVRRDGTGDRTLDAHAWVECNGEIVVGRVERFEEYVVLSPAPPPPG